MEDQVITREKVYRSRYLAGQVRRWHTWPTIRSPNVAEHCCRVAQIYCEVFGLPRAEVLYYCLYHDNGELYAGDVPFGAKRRVSGYAEVTNEAEKIGLAAQGVVMPQLTELEWTRFKICDLLEMHEFSLHECRLGNQYAETPCRDTNLAALDLADKIDGRAAVQQWTLRAGGGLP